jgi:hypothetical protein
MNQKLIALKTEIYQWDKVLSHLDLLEVGELLETIIELLHHPLSLDQLGEISMVIIKRLIVSQSITDIEETELMTRFNLTHTQALEKDPDYDPRWQDFFKQEIYPEVNRMIEEMESIRDDHLWDQEFRKLYTFLLIGFQDRMDNIYQKLQLESQKVDKNLSLYVDAQPFFIFQNRFSSLYLFIEDINEFDAQTFD